MAKKATWGGAREGAGRPEKKVKPVMVSVPLPAVVVDALDAMATAGGVNRSELVRRLLAKSSKELATAFKEAAL